MSESLSYQGQGARTFRDFARKNAAAWSEAAT